LAVDPVSSATVYAGTLSGGVFKSTDGAQHWAPASTGITTLQIKSIAVDPGTPSTVYAATYGGGIFKSVDGAATWASMSNGIGSLFLRAVAVDPTTPSTVLAGGDGGMYRSVNGGAVWTQTLSITGESIAFDPSVPGRAYSDASFAGVAVSKDGGVTWADLNSRFPALSVNVVAVGPFGTGAHLVYAGTYGGGAWDMTTS
jgi:photosystem II stability/assembly factor-like uncharacterized protein